MRRFAFRLVISTAVLVILRVMLAQASDRNERVDHDLVDQQRPNVLSIDYDAPPRNWKDAIRRADLVATIRLRSHSQAQLSTKLPMTRFEADVIEVVGGTHAGSAGASVVVLRTGGMRQVGGRQTIVEETGFPVWAVGRTVLVFLRWAEGYQAYVLPFGPDSAFELEPQTGKVQTSAHGQLAARQRGRRFSDLVGEIKASVR